MSLSKYFDGSSRGLSFELFPPKTEEGIPALLDTVGELSRYTPDFYTCTYGAGGSTQNRTMQVATSVKQRFQVPVASHLTCVGSTVDQLRAYLQNAWDNGVEHIVALRGDPPKGETSFTAIEGGLRYANELVELIKREFPQFGIAVAGYPETHQEAPSFEVDIQNLKRKVDAGADIIVTQLFYQNEDFFRFCDACEKVGIDIPIVPGIMPVTNLAQIKRITSMCKAALPVSFLDKLAESEDAQWQFGVGVEFAQNQVRELLDQGVPGMHFYVLNKFQATAAVLDAVEYVS
jgi:methylenetetrahydrofolate reductase (NADPH)